MNINKRLLILAPLLWAGAVQAENKPVAEASDTRIKSVLYQEKNVVPLNGVAFVTTHIQFGDKEEVLDIEGGDTAAWMVTYHKALANTVFVKPTLYNSNSNLTIITNQHVYYFHLHSARKKEALARTYALHFRYAAPKVPKVDKPSQAHVKTEPTKPRVLNTAYRFSGSPQLLPLHVFDDGQFTYFELGPQSVAPAIFAVEDKTGRESTVNTRRSGKYLIVQRIAPQFTLRYGKMTTSVFNTEEINRIASNRRPQ